MLAACSADLGGTGSGPPAPPVDAGIDSGLPVDAGPRIDAGDAGTPDAAPTLRSCDGLPSGSQQTQTGYLQPLARPPALCESGLQTRTCVDGSWTPFGGDFPYANCVVEGFDSCDGQPHGSVQTRSVYTAGQAVSAAACAAAAAPITRKCSDGTWSAWSEGPLGSVEACTVVAGGGCASVGELAGYACAQGTCDGARCVLGAGSPCADNVQCADTCIGGRCAARPPALGACDDTDDCSATACGTGAQCAGGQCLCNDGSACGDDNALCVNTCRAASCAPRGGACDAQDARDCLDGDPCYLSGSTWICVSDVGTTCDDDEPCQVQCVAGLCGLPLGLFGQCENDDDCEAALKCASVSWSLVKLCLRDKGATCTSSAACVSESCGLDGGGASVCQ